MKKQNAVQMLFVVLILLVLLDPALAALDQEHAPSVDIFTQFNERPVAQRFTVGITGQLTQIDVFMSQLDPAGNMIIEIQQGLTCGEVTLSPKILTSTSIPCSSLPSSSAGGTGPDFVSISLPIPHIDVSLGDELAIVLRRDMGGQTGQFGLVWFGSMSSDYSGGEALQFRPAGWVFDIDGNSYYLPDRWESNPQLPDYAFRTYIDPIPEPATLSLLTLGAVLIRRKK